MYIEPVKDVIDAGAFAFTDLNSLAGWQTTMGLAFENLVVNNYRRILEHLHLGRALVTSTAPYAKRGSKSQKTAGCRVDLLVQTAGSVCLVEIKRREQIGMEIIDEMRERVAAFPKMRGKSVRTALVYDGTLAPTVEANGYFDAIVPFDRLLA